MHSVVISDTSCLITFSKIKELELLHKVYGVIIITPEVAMEFGESLPEWITILAPRNKNLQEQLAKKVDIGEASSIALALELSNTIIIIDDYVGRKLANAQGLIVTGTLGVIIKAKNMSIIDSVKPIIDKIKTTNFRVSNEVEVATLKLAKEL
jgi:predicted nucleic acid-binding protein